jgi:hypothetical protein
MTQHQRSIPNTLKETREYIDELISFLDKYKSFWEAHATNFFVESVWETVIPTDWKPALIELTEHDLLYMATFGLTHDQRVCHF